MADDPGIIKQTDLADCALVFAAMQSATPFSARDFTAWLQIGAVVMEEEEANEILLGQVTAGKLREIGPGVYAVAPGITAPMEHPLWPGHE